MTEKQIEKARKLRYKKAIVDEINYGFIRDTLYQIQDDCEEVHIYCKDDFDNLVDVLGDDEEAEEFAVQFSALSSDCYDILQDLRDYDVPDYFDDFFIAVKGGDFGGGLVGYDSCECDYSNPT